MNKDLMEGSSYYLAYVKGTTGVVFPQLWHGDQTKPSGQFQDAPVGQPGSRLVSFYELSPGEEKLSLDALVLRHPSRDGEVRLRDSVKRNTTTRIMGGLGHRDLRDANCARQLEWDKRGVITLAFRANELGGEVGEAQNIIKKLSRVTLDLGGSRSTVMALANELGDVIICCDLTAIKVGTHLSLTEVFSAPSFSLLQLGCQMHAASGRVSDMCVGIEMDGGGLVEGEHRRILRTMLEEVVSVVNRIASDLGINMDLATRMKFNLTSEKYGLSTRMEMPSHA